MMSHAIEHRLAGTVGRCDESKLDASPSCHLGSGREAKWSALGKGVQGLAMIAAGVFLLSRISTAPQLAIQVIMLGALLVVGGCAFAIIAIATMTSHMTVDRDGIRGRLGRTAFDIAWADVAQWRVSDHDDRLSAVDCAEVWTHGGTASRSLPGGFFDREARRRLRESCRSFAPEREQR